MAPFSLYQVNPSPSSAAYMRHWTGSSLVQVMACLLFGAKPLPELMLAYCQLDSCIIKWNLNRNSIIFIKENVIWKCRLPKWRGWVGWVWVCGWGRGGGGGGVGGGGGRGWGGGEWSVKCLLDTWLGIGANWHNKYCTMCYIALFICPALSLGSKCT